MNKKIILLITVLFIVAIVFVACKGKGDVEETTESTTETTESTSVNLEINDMSNDDLEMGIIPEVFEEDDMLGEGVIHIGGDSGEHDGEDSISWDEF